VLGVRYRLQPRSHPILKALSDQRQRDLTQYIGAVGYTFFPGYGEPPDASWQPEPSLLILGISQDAALRLGAALGQNAIVMGTRGGARFGDIAGTAFSGDYLALDPAQTAEIIAILEEAGYRCVQDQELLDKACGVR
jgi:hypothetical protein